jgi:hypothetical protein
VTERTLWLVVVVFVAACLWLVAGAVFTVTDGTRVTIATAPEAEPVIASIEGAPHE